MNVNQAIENLQNLQSLGFGELEINVYQYAGGNDELCDVHFVVQDSDIVLIETTYVNT